MIPTASAAASCTPLAIALIALLCTIISLGAWRSECPRWLSGMRFAALIMITASILNWTHSCWKGNYTEIAVPAVLLVLAELAIEKGSEKAARSAGILRYSEYAILVILVIMGIPGIQMRNLTMQWSMADYGLILVLLLPLLGERKPKKVACSMIAALAVVTGIIVTGTMRRGKDLYTYARILPISGGTQRIESIVAAIMTVGYYSVLTYVLVAMDRQWNNVRGKKNKMGVRIGALLAFVAYLIIKETLAISTVMVLAGWVGLPLIIEMKKKMEKNEKNA